MKDKSPVSLTGHFTGYVWCQNKLSPPSFGSLLGKAMYLGSRPIDLFSNRILGWKLETMLLQRHQIIDSWVNQALDEGVTQIVEIASGLSARGLRLLKNRPYDSFQYVEADLPDMVKWKQQRLNKEHFHDDRHRLTKCNILRTEGELSIEHLLSSLDTTQKTLVITEGLVNYFSLGVIEGFWTRLAEALSAFSEASYLFEIWPQTSDYGFASVVSATQRAIELITRQKVPLHYTHDSQIKEGLEHCGFSIVEVCNPDNMTESLPLPKMRSPSLFRLVRATI